MKGVAPIKAQFLLATPKKTGIAKEEESVPADKDVKDLPSDAGDSTQAAEKRSSDAIATEQNNDVNPKKRKRKGQNKQREKFSNQRSAPEHRLCKAIICDTVCSYGDSCKFSHDIADFISKKPADLPGTCYNFVQFGRCPYGFACRYAQSHMKEVDGKYINVVNEEVTAEGKSVNSLSKENLFLLRKHKYDFSKATKATKDAQLFVDKIVKRNFEQNCTKKSARAIDPPPQENVLGTDEVKETECQQTESVDKKVTSEGLGNSASKPMESNSTDCETTPKATGPLTNEDEFSIKPGEKKTIDFKNKLYLAPLTTVGNLPFRRVCKTYGADVTCGEMALATKLLQGVSSEWALVKRHSSEDVFGVQICGAFADTMSKCTQLLTETCDVDFIDVNVGCPIDLIFDQGSGSALMRRLNRFHEIVHSMVQVSDKPITVKIRTGISETKNTAHTLIPKLRDWGVTLTTLHGRSREQRYTKSADWTYIDECAAVAAPMPLYGGGDILSFEDYNDAMKTNVSGTMLARGALIKPWLFTEVKEQRHWDISSAERLDILRDFSNYGMEHWGSDQQGIETTRRFMLEWLSFLHRYIPVGLLERIPQKINERPSPYVGRDDLETLMASPNSADWVKISEMLLGPVPDGFFFIPKHRANSYS